MVTIKKLSARNPVDLILLAILRVSQKQNEVIPMSKTRNGISPVLNNHRLKPVGLCCGLKVRIRVA